MQTILLDPEEVKATYQDGVLTIEARGHEEGCTDIQIVGGGNVEPIEPPLPPQFRVEGVATPAIGVFPYHVEASFPMADDPHTITLVTQTGSRTIEVRSLTSH
jgi:hypothetical protein